MIFETISVIHTFLCFCVAWRLRFFWNEYLPPYRFPALMRKLNFSSQHQSGTDTFNWELQSTPMCDLLRENTAMLERSFVRRAKKKRMHLGKRTPE